MIPRCLTKIKREKTVFMLVCPLWPSQPWFFLLLEMATDILREFSSYLIQLDPYSFELSRSTPTHSIEKIPPSRMEIIRGRLEKRGLPPAVVRQGLGTKRKVGRKKKE
jgi:hypothetical protein